MYASVGPGHCVCLRLHAEACPLSVAFSVRESKQEYVSQRRKEFLMASIASVLSLAPAKASLRGCGEYEDQRLALGDLVR